MSTDEMSKKIKKELVDRTTNESSFKDKLCAEGVFFSPLLFEICY